MPAVTGPAPHREAGDTAAGRHVVHGCPGHSARAAASDQREAFAAPWLLAGLTGAGAVLAGSVLTLLRRRRRAQFRARRPGRTITVPAPTPSTSAAAKTVVVTGTAGAATVAGLDALLRRLAADQTTAGRSMPDLAAVACTDTEVTVHLRRPGDLPPPWRAGPDRMHWTCPHPHEAATPAPGVGEEDARPAPYPLLVTIGADTTGAVWLLNLDVMAAVTITGDPDRSAGFVRYLAAELACNPWSSDVRVDCVGAGHEAAAMNPHRVRVHTDTAAVCGDGGRRRRRHDRPHRSVPPTARTPARIRPPTSRPPAPGSSATTSGPPASCSSTPPDPHRPNSTSSSTWSAGTPGGPPRPSSWPAATTRTRSGSTSTSPTPDGSRFPASAWT